MIDDYPAEINTLGDLLRKTRLDQGFQIKDLQKILNAAESSIVNLESHNNFPRGDNLKRVVGFIETHQSDSILRNKILGLCFSENPAYPSHPKTFGEKLRAARMQNFMTIKQLAQELGVNECTVSRWEIKDSHPNPNMMERVRNFLASCPS